MVVYNLYWVLEMASDVSAKEWLQNSSTQFQAYLSTVECEVKLTPIRAHICEDYLTYNITVHNQS